MRFKSSVGLDRHLNAGITLARWGAYTFLGMAGLVTAFVTVTGLFASGSLPDEAVAQVGGTFFYLFLSVIGLFLVLGFVGNAAVEYIFKRVEN